MEIICEHCGFVMNRDKKIDREIVEEYRNVYGTYCSNCGKKIAPQITIKDLTEKENRKNILIEKVRERLRKLVGGNNGY